MDKERPVIKKIETSDFSNSIHLLYKFISGSAYIIPLHHFNPVFAHSHSSPIVPIIFTWRVVPVSSSSTLLTLGLPDKAVALWCSSSGWCVTWRGSILWHPSPPIPSRYAPGPHSVYRPDLVSQLKNKRCSSVMKLVPVLLLEGPPDLESRRTDLAKRLR